MALLHTEMKQVILFLLILNLLNTRQVLQEILIILVQVMLVIMLTKLYHGTKIVVPLKHLSNFWRTLNIPLINCEIELVLAWSKSFAFANVTERDAGNNNDPPAIVTPTELELQVTDTKLYVTIITLSTENDKKLLEQLKSRLKRTIKWNKYRSQIVIQSNINNLNHLTDPTFAKVRLLEQKTDCLRTDYLCYPLKESKKNVLKKIIEILFQIFIYQMLK